MRSPLGHCALSSRLLSLSSLTRNDGARRSGPLLTIRVRALRTIFSPYFLLHACTHGECALSAIGRTSDPAGMIRWDASCTVPGASCQLLPTCLGRRASVAVRATLLGLQPDHARARGWGPPPSLPAAPASPSPFQPLHPGPFLFSFSVPPPAAGWRLDGYALTIPWPCVYATWRQLAHFVLDGAIHPNTLTALHRPGGAVAVGGWELRPKREKVHLLPPRAVTSAWTIAVTVVVGDDGLAAHDLVFVTGWSGRGDRPPA